MRSSMVGRCSRHRSKSCWGNVLALPAGGSACAPPAESKPCGGASRTAPPAWQAAAASQGVMSASLAWPQWLGAPAFAPPAKSKPCRGVFPPGGSAFAPPTGSSPARGGVASPAWRAAAVSEIGTRRVWPSVFAGCAGVRAAGHRSSPIWGASVLLCGRPPPPLKVWLASRTQRFPRVGRLVRRRRFSSEVRRPVRWPPRSSHRRVLPT